MSAWWWRLFRLKLYRWLFADIVKHETSLTLIRWRDAGNMLNAEQKRKLECEQWAKREEERP